MKKFILCSIFSVLPLYVPKGHTQLPTDCHKTNVTLKIEERWFQDIFDQKKTIEGREGNLKRGKFKCLRYGDTITFKSPTRKLVATVLSVHQYSTIEAYLIQEGLRKTLPGITSLNNASAIYHKFYSDASVLKAGGMLAIEIKAHKESIKMTI